MTTENELQEEIRPFEWLTSPKSLESLIQSLPSITLCQPPKNALHVGSGSSAVGEFLVEELGFEKVVDADRDAETLVQMKTRWLARCQKFDRMDELHRLEHQVVDFTQGKVSCPDESFDLILDKSTLDCTLCSDHAAASLLAEVYRCLAVQGVYVLISFHELDLLQPLLEDLPGADWKISCQTMERQVERLETCVDGSGNSSDTIPPATKSLASQEGNIPSTKPLNVLVAHKQSSGNLDSFENICTHIHHVNDQWFQESHPLLTHQRIEELQKSFAEPLPVQDAYVHLFTTAEREHLTYQHFLEDWQAYIRVDNSDNNAETVATLQNGEKVISFEIAVAFLKEMQ